MSEEGIRSVGIVGAGPAGLWTAFQLGLYGLTDVILWENAPKIGGQPTWLYPESTVYDMPGIFSVRAENIAEGIKRQIAPFDGFKFCLNTGVHPDQIQRRDGAWEVQTVGGVHRVRVIVFATGSGALGGKFRIEPKLRGLPEFGTHSFAVGDLWTSHSNSSKLLSTAFADAAAKAPEIIKSERQSCGLPAGRPILHYTSASLTLHRRLKVRGAEIEAV